MKLLRSCMCALGISALVRSAAVQTVPDAVVAGRAAAQGQVENWGDDRRLTFESTTLGDHP
jgi:hypothetical protein